MNSRLPGFFQLAEHNISPEDVVHAFLHCDPVHIHENVVIMPHWKEGIFSRAAEDINEIVPDRLYGLRYKGQWMSIIRSGIGAPLTGDVILALGCTPCKKIVFTGSVGGLGSRIRIGDLVLVEKSFCGDGFSRYLDPEVIPKDCFLQPAEPDCQLTVRIQNSAKHACAARPVSFHEGAVFSTDSILAQFFRLDYLTEELKCIGIEMETAAVFRAARLVGIRAAALLQASDVPRQNKSVLAGRTEEEMQHRKMIRQDVLAVAVLNSLLF